jgi:hypothetical protein
MGQGRARTIGAKALLIHPSHQGVETKLEQITVKAVNQLSKSVVREIRTPRCVSSEGWHVQQETNLPG